MRKFINKYKFFSTLLFYSFIFLLFIFVLNYFKSNLFLISNNDLDYFIRFRDIVINFLNIGNFNFFTWDVFLGNDLFLNYIYLMLGDFLSYFCVLFPVSSLSNLYSVLVYIRLFLVGISFLLYCKRVKLSSISSLIGTFIYVFSSCSLYYSINNPYILNIMFLVPFILIGIEKLVFDNKKSFFIFFVSLALITNIYFLLFILLLILFYSTILIFNKYFIYGIKVIFNAYLRIILSLIVCFLISSVVLVPFVFSNYNYFLNINNYFNISILGLNGIFLVYFPLAFRKFKENKNYIFLFILIGLLLFINIFNNNFIFNNNITFILSFISSILISKTIDLYSNISRIDFKWIISFFGIVLLVVFIFNIEISRLFLFTLITGFVYLILLLNKKDFKSKTLYLFLFSIFLIFSIGFNLFNVFKTNDSILYDTKDITSNVISLIEDDSFYRVVLDDSQLIEVNDYNYLNNLYRDFLVDLNVLSMNDFNNRTKLLSLVGEKYYITNNGDLYVPKKHKLLYEKDGYSVYENKYYIGLGSFYDTYVPSNIYNDFNSLEKESSLFKSVIVDDKDIDNDYLKQNNFIRDEINNEVIKVSSTIRKDESKLFIKLDNISVEGELYLEINNFKSNGGIISFEFRDRIYNKKVTMEENLLINFTSFGRFDEEIVIDLSQVDNYTYDSINAYIVSFDNYVDDIEKLKSSNFEILEYNDSLIKAKVNSETKGFLQLSTAYSKNWDVFVDGVQVDTYLSNNYFLGIYINEGVHEIEFVYNFEYLIFTYILFGVGLALFCGILIIETGKNGVNREKRKKRS